MRFWFCAFLVSSTDLCNHTRTCVASLCQKAETAYQGSFEECEGCDHWQKKVSKHFLEIGPAARPSLLELLGTPFCSEAEIGEDDLDVWTMPNTEQFSQGVLRRMQTILECGVVPGEEEDSQPLSQGQASQEAGIEAGSQARSQLELLPRAGSMGSINSIYQADQNTRASSELEMPPQPTLPAPPMPQESQVSLTADEEAVLNHLQGLKTAGVPLGADLEKQYVDLQQKAQEQKSAQGLTHGHLNRFHRARDQAAAALKKIKVLDAEWNETVLRAQTEFREHAALYHSSRQDLMETYNKKLQILGDLKAQVNQAGRVCGRGTSHRCGDAIRGTQAGDGESFGGSGSDSGRGRRRAGRRSSRHGRSWRSDRRQEAEEDKFPRVTFAHKGRQPELEAQAERQVRGESCFDVIFEQFRRRVATIKQHDFLSGCEIEQGAKCQSRVSFSPIVEVLCWNDDHVVACTIPCVSMHSWLRTFWSLHGQFCDWEAFHRMNRIVPKVPWSNVALNHETMPELTWKSDGQGEEATADQEFARLDCESVENDVDPMPCTAERICSARRQHVVETWFVNPEFSVCAQSRNVRISGKWSRRGFEEECRKVWNDLIDEGSLEIVAVQMSLAQQPICSRFILHQRKPETKAVLLAHYGGWPILNSRRAVMYEQGCSVNELMDMLQLRRVCSRQLIHCALNVHTPAEILAFTQHENVRLRDGSYVEAVVRVEDVEETSDDEVGTDATAGSVSTACPSEDSDDDDTFSLSMTRFANVVSHNFDNPIRHMWNEWEDHLAQEDEAEEYHPELSFAAGHRDLVEDAVHDVNDQDDREGEQNLAITYGLGIASLGRRDVYFDRGSLNDLADKIAQLWHDHLARANAEILLVQPQPILPPRPNLVLIVAFQYGQDLDENTKRVLVMEDSAFDVEHNEQPYAALLESPATARRITAELGFHHCFPLGIRSCEVIVSDHFLEQDELCHIRDGALVQTYVGAVPEIVFDLQHMVANVEPLFILARGMRENRGYNVQVILRIHGISPRNTPLGHRDIVCNVDDLAKRGWLRQAQELWPFGIENIARFAFISQVNEEYGDSTPVFHLIVNYARNFEGVPILLRQVLCNMDSMIPYEERWAFVVKVGDRSRELGNMLSTHPFWWDPETHQVLSRCGQEIDQVDVDWKPGEVATLTIFMGSQTAMTSWLLRHHNLQADSRRTIQHVSLLQTQVSLKKRTPFADVCSFLCSSNDESDGSDEGLEERPLVPKEGSKCLDASIGSGLPLTPFNQH